MNKDQVKGAVKEATGKVQEVTGKVIGNPEQEAKGVTKQAQGKALKKARRRPGGCGGVRARLTRGLAWPDAGFGRPRIDARDSGSTHGTERSALGCTVR